MTPISVIISSLRPDRLEATIDNIASEQELVEVVVATPYPPKRRDFVKHIPVPPPGDPNELTFTQKFNLAAENASGEYLIFNNDDIHFVSPGWAKSLLMHMAQEKTRPYLAALPIRHKGHILPRYTIFGLLYGNHGCIRKSDLQLIGGKLLDERIRMYYSELDLALRVWSQGGKVGICSEVVLDSDRDVDQVAIDQRSKFRAQDNKKATIKTYRDAWYRQDTDAFFKLWFWKYFWLYWSHYSKLYKQFTNEDGVLPPKRYNDSLLKIMFWPIINMYLNPQILTSRPHKINFVRKHFLRVANRRWGQLSYQLPYSPQSVVRKGI
jgi:hypothetical protein